ncbi:Hermansky-Pudlak syndrome 1 protein homolog isoform X2 [Diaphorina citri]|uniref:Hermansky-Pudlak syndrome 1 protein homolog isoform X2 n=1 Tax=Diaphorina citri TaxID=121845 RepID=A0A3Q0JL24_DIACI|nr:Hermansky-Pudlak syndrome 1 protein homolog isoform X2 [Diaphorina citri]
MKSDLPIKFFGYYIHLSFHWSNRFLINNHEVSHGRNVNKFLTPPKPKSEKVGAFINFSLNFFKTGLKMKCILIFDQLNDVMYSKCDPGFVKHLKKYARKEGFNIDREEKDDHSLSTDELIQIFSPIVTSARVMGWQFSNSYISIQCDDGINLVFDEYMGHILIIIGHGEVQWLQRIIKTCSFFIKNLCGPDITLLKESSQVHDLLSNMIDTWCSLRHSDQNILVEGVEQLSISSDLAATAIKALEMSAQCYKKIADFKNVHSFVLVHNKILSLYSSCRNNIELTAADSTALSIISTSLQATKTSVCPEYSDPESKTTTSEEEFYSLEASPTVKRKRKQPTCQ